MAWVEQVGERSYRVRYAVDGKVRSVSGFASRRDANDYALDLESDRRRGRWIDPAAGRVTVGEWAGRWLGTLDLDTRTVENYGHRIRRHIEPRWGVVSLRDVTASAVTIRRNELLGWLAPGTVRGVLTVFSMMLDDAVDERLIEANPLRRRHRRGRRHRGCVPKEKVWAEPEQVLRVADQATLLGGYACGLLIVTAGWTGVRWGELAGLERDNVDLRRRRIHIDPYPDRCTRVPTGCGWVRRSPRRRRARSCCRRSSSGCSVIISPPPTGRWCSPARRVIGCGVVVSIDACSARPRTATPTSAIPE